MRYSAHCYILNTPGVSPDLRICWGDVARNPARGADAEVEPRTLT